MYSLEIIIMALLMKYPDIYTNKLQAMENLQWPEVATLRMKGHEKA